MIRSPFLRKSLTILRHTVCVVVGVLTFIIGYFADLFYFGWSDDPTVPVTEKLVVLAIAAFLGMEWLLPEVKTPPEKGDG